MMINAYKYRMLSVRSGIHAAGVNASYSLILDVLHMVEHLHLGCCLPEQDYFRVDQQDFHQDQPYVGIKVKKVFQKKCRKMLKVPARPSERDGRTNDFASDYIVYLFASI